MDPALVFCVPAAAVLGVTADSWPAVRGPADGRPQGCASAGLLVRVSAAD